MAAPLDDRALRSVHLELLGRPPFASERETWLGGRADELVATLLGGLSCWEHWVQEQLWYFLLVGNFRPASEGVHDLPGALASRRLSALEALHRIALSPAFDLRNPGADTFVTVVLEQITGTNVQKQARELELGKRAYDGARALFLGRPAASQSDVVRVAIESERAVRHLIAREHERILRRPPEPAALAAWTRELSREPLRFPELVAEWLASPAWSDRGAAGAPLSNRSFVRALFVDLFDALPEAAEAEAMRSALDSLADPRPLRSVLARLLLDSGSVPLPAREDVPDPTLFVADLFRRLLGREARQSELAEFVRAYHASEGRIETLLLALLSHPAYHQY